MAEPLYAFDEQLIAGLAGLPADEWIASARLQWADMPTDEEPAESGESAGLPVEDTGSFFESMSADISGPLLTVDTPLTDFELPENGSWDGMAGMEWLAEANAAYNSVFGSDLLSVDGSTLVDISDNGDAGETDLLSAFISEITGEPLVFVSGNDVVSDTSADSDNDLITFPDTTTAALFGDDANVTAISSADDDTGGDATDLIPYPTTNLTSDYLAYLDALAEAGGDGDSSVDASTSFILPEVPEGYPEGWEYLTSAGTLLAPEDRWWETDTLADPDMPL